MKALRLFMVLLAVMLCGLPADAGPENIVQNGSFETLSPPSWQPIPWMPAAPGGSVGIFGNWPNAPDGTNFASLVTSFSQTISTTPGQSYTLSFYAAGVFVYSRTSTVEVDWGGQPAAILTTQPYPHTTNAHPTLLDLVWEQFSTPVLASSTSTLLTFRALNGTHLCVDDVWVVPIPEPGVAALILIGAFYFAKEMRKKKSSRCVEGQKTTMKRKAAVVIVALIVGNAQAAIYDVDRNFTSGLSNATLTGTLEIPIGSYTIVNRGPSPFTSVNLTLTVDASAYNLTNALTGIIFGTGEFFINATATTLTFSIANANGGNPADLEFSDNTAPMNNNRYVIGYDYVPGFEAAFTDAGSLHTTATFPVVFGVVPEPSSFALAGVAAAATLALRRRK